MKLLKQFLFGLKIYLFICFLFSLFAIVFEESIGDNKKIDCDKFILAELVVPVTPMACLLKTQVHP